MNIQMNGYKMLGNPCSLKKQYWIQTCLRTSARWASFFMSSRRRMPTVVWTCLNMSGCLVHPQHQTSWKFDLSISLHPKPIQWSAMQKHSRIFTLYIHISIYLPIYSNPIYDLLSSLIMFYFSLFLSMHVCSYLFSSSLIYWYLVLSILIYSYLFLSILICSYLFLSSLI